jgi:hypothetical protein
MNDQEQNPIQDPRTQPDMPEISVNEYGQAKDPAVVVDEANRTVLLTPDETIVFEKQPSIDIVPKNRPREVYAGMWGRNEIATFALGIFALLTVIILYVFVVMPSNRQLARHKSEAEALEQQLVENKARWGAITDSQSQVTNILGSEEQFESTYLRPASMGTNEIPRRLNSLIAAYGLVNTNGPEYQPLETIDAANNGRAAQSSDQDRGRDRFRSLFPGMYVTMTVEGSYQNLRRFIKELENGSEFIVISTVQLEPSDSKSDKQDNGGQQTQAQAASPVIQQGPNQIGNPYNYARPGFQPNVQPQPADNFRTNPDRGKMHGELVSLHLEMAAYFRRPDFVPTVSQ